jgi:ABC-2 type transport system permease protein
MTRPSWARIWVITRTDLRQLREARDFWVPLTVVAGLFFVVIPGVLLLIVSSLRDSEALRQLSDTIGELPRDLRHGIHGDLGAAQAAYTLAVSLFPPLAIVVPLTVASAVGAHTLVGERERGSGEFLAQSPAAEHEIYTGKLLASLIPGYLTGAVGFGCYTVLVNLIVGPKVGGWFFPTTNWLLMVVWVLPPFITLALAIILAISARVSSAAAAQQASALATLPLMVIAYAVGSNTFFEGSVLALGVGALAWLVAAGTLVRASRTVSRARLLGVGSS